MDDLTDLVSVNALTALRRDFSEEQMVEGAARSVGRYDAHAVGWVKVVRDDLYRSARQAPMDRQRCMIMACALSAEVMPLAVHTYWGLMAGLEVPEVAQILLLAGTYGGLAHYTQSCQVVASLLELLAQQAARDPSMGATSQAVLARFFKG